MQKKYLKTIFIIALFSYNLIFSQSNFYEPKADSLAKWSREDFGKMWTFDSVPVEDIKAQYGFDATEEWLDDVQKSALQFGGGCSAAFVSESGLIMTNHHCGRGQLGGLQKEGEELLKDGFYAITLDEERKVPNLFVDQLILIEDVTDEIKTAMSEGENDTEKIKLRDEKKSELIKQYNEETELNCRIVTLYNGGKFSLYAYKRYNDVRLVMAPDFQIAATGWDWDNFTYPRYELDFMFYRAYDEDGNPAEVENYFKWSKKGAKVDEPIFVVGRPGRTDRLVATSQLEYFRDEVYPNSLIGFNAIYNAYFDLYQKKPDDANLLNRVMGWGNARKSYAGRLAGLKNDFIMAKKKDFEKEFQLKVKSDEELNLKYGHLWDAIEKVINPLTKYQEDQTVGRFSRFIKPIYFALADELIKVAEQKKLSNDERLAEYKNDKIDSTVTEKFPKEIDSELQYNLLLANVDFVTKVLAADHPLVKKVYGRKKGKDAVDHFLATSKLVSLEGFLEMTKLSSDEILNNDDPFIKFSIMVRKRNKEIKNEVKELTNTLAVLNQQLGEAIFEVYGNKISPDATSTLRISDGRIKGYEYNGTIAPGKTTYYGLWDRYESFNKKTYPWGLHERWKTPPKDLDLATNIGFASTNDIVGGNSGSSVININQEVVGLVHDGNIESLAGHTIFLEENNRTVATDSDGLIEALKYVYKTDRLVKELLEAK
ncbi:MAG: S46 family peptidase [Ignavibacteriae bacterium]|nr:S46 family peptidase [Ignavibacteriota bacterium]